MANKRKQPRAEHSKQRAIMLKVDEDIRNELDVLALSRGESVQQLGIEAVCDLLEKYGRPVNLADALRKSAARPNAAKSKSPRAGPARAKSKRR